MSEIFKRDLDEYKQMAERACEAWGFQGGDIELIRNGENVTYKVISDQKMHCLRITDESHRSSGQIKAELDWISYLSNNDVNVAEPLKSLKDDLFLMLKVKDKTYFASFFRWAEGDLFKPEANLNEDCLKSYGSLVGKIHRLTKSYRPDNLLEKRKVWEGSRHIQHAIELIDSQNSEMTPYWLEAKSWYDSLEKTYDSYGLAHIDMHTGNFHVENNTDLTVFDFDDSAYCFYTYDIVVPLMSLFSTQTDVFPYEKMEEIFLEAYLKENSLKQIWLDRISSFVRLRNIEMYSWVQFMYGKNKEDRHKEYFEKVENSMRQDFKFI